MLFRQSPLLGWRLTIATIVSIVLMFCDQRSAVLSRVHFSLDTLVAPLQFVVAAPSSVLDWVDMTLVAQQQLIRTNNQLQAQLLLLQGRLQQQTELLQENQQLRDLIHASGSFAANKLTLSHVLAVADDGLLDQLIIDKGADAHIYIGQAVLDATGVMGQVVRVGQLTSRVMVLADTQSAIPVQCVRSSVRGIVIGTGAQRPLSMINVPSTADIKVGDILNTSGLDLRFPPGYPVGQVIAIHRSPGEHFARIGVRPLATLDKSQLVLLVWQNAPAQMAEAKQDLKQIGKEHQQDAVLRNTLSNTNL